MNNYHHLTAFDAYSFVRICWELTQLNAIHYMNYSDLSNSPIVFQISYYYVHWRHALWLILHRKRNGRRANIHLYIYTYIIYYNCDAIQPIKFYAKNFDIVYSVFELYAIRLNQKENYGFLNILTVKQLFSRLNWIKVLA